MAVRRRAAACGLLGLLLPLAGCRPGAGHAGAEHRSRLHASIVMAVGVNSDLRLDRDLLDDIQRWSGDLVRAFRSVQPRVQVEVQPLPEAAIARELARRSRDGLAPDLLLVNSSDTAGLAAAGLIRPIRVPATVLDAIRPDVLAGVRRGDGRLVGLPLLIQPQLACYDRRRVPRPPASWAELMALAGGRLRVGLPIDPINLAWTLRPLGGFDTVRELAGGRPANDTDRQRLRAWLEELRQAYLQRGVRMLAQQDDLLRQLADGQLDWMPCRSNHLERLERRLGSHLGVGLLPAGPGGPASPVNRARLLVFGINSTPAQRQAAEALARFSVQPLAQSTIVQLNRSLSVSRQPLPPTALSNLQSTLDDARRQGEAATALGRLRNEGDGRFRRLLTDVLYGESDSRSAGAELAALLAPEPTR